MAIGSFCYALLNTACFIISLKFEIGMFLSYAIMIAGASLCGMAASCIWVAQGVYIANIVPVESRNEMYGLFWGIRMTANILGNLISTFALSILNIQLYFIILVTLGCKSKYI
jgi:MFS family permease